MLGAHEAAACRKAAASEAALLPIATRGSAAFTRLLRCECADAEARCEELNALARWAEVLRQPGGGAGGASSSLSAEIAACRRRAQRVAVAQAEACRRPARLEACVAVLLLALDAAVNDDSGGEAAAAASSLVAAYVAQAAGRAAKERREGGATQELRPLTLPRVEHSVLKALCRNEDGSTLLALQLAAVSRACLAGVCPLLRPLVLGTPPDAPARDAAVACTFLIETAAVAAGKPASWADVLKGLAGWGGGGGAAVAAAAAAPRPPQSLEVLSSFLRSVRRRSSGAEACGGDAEPAAAVGFTLFQESLLVRPLPRPPLLARDDGDGGPSAEDVCLARWVRVCLDAAADADEGGGGGGDVVCWASSDGIRELFTAGDFTFTAATLTSSPSPLPLSLSLSQHEERESAFVEVAPPTGVGLSGAWELRTPRGGRRHDMVLSGWPLGGGRGAARAYNVSIVGGSGGGSDEEAAAGCDCHGVLTPYDAPPCGDASDGGGRIPFPAAAAAAAEGSGGGLLSCVLPQYHAVMSNGGVLWAALPYSPPALVAGGCSDAEEDAAGGSGGAAGRTVAHLDVYRHDSLALLCAGEGRATRFDAVRCGGGGGGAAAAAAASSADVAEALPPPHLEARHLLSLLRAALLSRGGGGGGGGSDDGGGFSPALCGAARSYLRCDMHGCLEGRLGGLLGGRPSCLREMAEAAAGGTAPVSASDAARAPLWCVLRDVLELSAAEAAEALRDEIVSAPPQTRTQTQTLPAADAVVCFAAAAAASAEAGDAAAAAAGAVASLLRAGGGACGGTESPLRPLVPLRGFPGLLVGQLLGVLAPTVLCDAAAWQPEAAAGEAVRAAAADVTAGGAPFLGFASLRECVREVCRSGEEGAEAATLSEAVVLCLHCTLAGLSLLGGGGGSSGHACSASLSEEAAGAATRCVDRWVCEGVVQAEEEEKAGGGEGFFGPLLLGYLRRRAATTHHGGGGGASVAFDVSLVTGSAAVAASAEAQAYLSAQVAEARALRRRVFPAAGAAEGSSAAPLDATLADLRRCAGEGVVIARNARCGGGEGAGAVAAPPLTAEEAAAAAGDGQVVLVACAPLFAEAEGRLRRVRRLLAALEGRGWIAGAGRTAPHPAEEAAAAAAEAAAQTEATLRALRTEAEEWETGVFGRCRVFAGLSSSAAVAAACTPEEALGSPILRGWWAGVAAEGGAAAEATAAERREAVSRVCDALERALAARVQEVAGGDGDVSVAQALGLSADGGGTAVAVAASDAAVEARVLEAAGVGEVGRRRVLAGRRLVKRTLALGGLFP